MRTLQQSRTFLRETATALHAAPFSGASTSSSLFKLGSPQVVLLQTLLVAFVAWRE